MDSISRTWNEAARRFGATDVIDSTRTKPVETVRDLLQGGADHVFDFVGQQTVAEQGLAMLGVGGGLYLVGVAKPEVDVAVNIFWRDRRTVASPGRELRFHQRQARYPHVRTVVPARPDEPG